MKIKMGTTEYVDVMGNARIDLRYSWASFKRPTVAPGRLSVSVTGGVAVYEWDNQLWQITVKASYAVAPVDICETYNSNLGNSEDLLKC